MRKVSIPGLHFGCSQIVMGSVTFRPEQKEQIYPMLDAYVQGGGNAIETGRIYGLFQSEMVLGAWIRERNNRKEMLISDKGGHYYVDEQGVHHPEQKRVKPDTLTQDLMTSLEKLQTDYIDIYMYHRDDPDVPVDELMDIMEEHQKAGLIRAYGVSNWSLERIEAACRYTSRKGYAGIAVTSPSLSLARANEPRWAGAVYADVAYLAWNERTQITMFSWASQASGFFTGAFSPDLIPVPDIARVYYSDGNWERYKRARQLAVQKGGGISANNIALAYVLNQSFPVCALIGPLKVEELKESLQAAHVTITTEERSWLDLQR